jgi:hypothetical protein
MRAVRTGEYFVTTSVTGAATSEDRDLDQLFGVLVAPSRLDPKEKSVSPRSLQKLEASSGTLLRQLMDVTERRLGVSAYVYCEVPILWIVDDRGDVWFSLEEVIDEETDEFTIPNLRDTPAADGYARLGHPSLVSANSARIAGEILFDVRAENPSWYITNASGRYGIGHDRKEDHLKEVSKLFRDFGINLFERFIFPRRRS